jgi:broad specificity phosphatase PhoE
VFVVRLVLMRHGQTEWSAAGRHTSHTDLALTPEGESEARALAARLVDRTFDAVVASPRLRALRSAELAGLTVTAVDADLAEWDYGEYEGLTTEEIRKHRRDWSLWTDGAPGGESPAEVSARIDRVLRRVSTVDGDVAVIGHGHALRVLTARWLGLPASSGALFRLDSGTISELGYEREQAVIQRWNLR